MRNSKSPSRILHSGIAALLWIAAWGAQAADDPLRNRLSGHASPYLRMHGADPVAWQEWGRDVLARARREDKLIYVSVGYFACHWCHVMQRESYRDPAIAAYVNAHFVPVKVDRELDPALDAELIEFSERTGGRAGWPLNVFLTPDGHPLYALLYLPPEEFHASIGRLQELWRSDRQRLQELARREAGPPPPPVGELKLDAAVAERWRVDFKDAALAFADPLRGGYGDTRKFPMAPQTETVLRLLARTDDAFLRRHLTLTLERIAAGGLRDHVGGGFFRYTVDPDWETPHFEKMLYDNAQLARAYLSAAHVLKRPDFEALGRETLDFLLARMREPSGAFVAAFSAVDDKNVEGGFYLWSARELETLLSADERRVVGAWYGMQGAAPFEAGYLPRRTMTAGEAAEKLGLTAARVEALWASARGKLLTARAHRKLPVDDKLLAGWNGLALSALVQGAMQTKEARYRDAADRLARYLGTVLWDGRQLRRAVKDGAPQGRPSLEDYAYVAQGLLEYATLTGVAADRELAGRVIEDAWRRHFDAGWRLAEEELLAGRAKRTAVDDGSLPSPAAVLMSTSVAYARMKPAAGLNERVAQALRLAQRDVEGNPFGHAGYITAVADFLTMPLRQ